MRYDTLTRTFDIFSEDVTLKGIRTFEVEAFFVEYPQVTSAAPNLVETIEIFDPCDRPYGLTDPGQEPKEYFYREGGISFTAGIFVVDPPVCTVSYECISSNCLLEPLQFETDGSIFFVTTDIEKYPPGELLFTVRGTVGNLVPITLERTVNITLVNPCYTVVPKK